MTDCRWMSVYTRQTSHLGLEDILFKTFDEVKKLLLVSVLPICGTNFLGHLNQDVKHNC